uniref:GT23 domain-containing protein n=1 Tax=Meloidogyne hapla TaxID=6305 RepID=A0A1I8BVZ7_MELHA
MTLIQKHYYLSRLYGINSTTSKAKKKRIEEYIIRQLKSERRLYNNTKYEMNQLLQVKLIDFDDTDCGFGCSIHHISYCLSLATGSERILILEKDGDNWSYNATWRELFEPITNCSYEENVRPFLPLPYYTGPEQTNRIVFARRREEMFLILNKKELVHSPEVAPKEIENFLSKRHANPPIWFLGQLLKYIWRFNEETKKSVNQTFAQIPFECGIQ